MSEFYYPDSLSAEELSQRPSYCNVVDVVVPTENTKTEKNSDEEIENFIMDQRAESTVSKTKSDVNTFSRYWKVYENEEREVHDIPLSQLDTLLCKFFIHVRRKDGKEYEPSTLTSLQRSLQRHLTGKGVKFNILRDEQFDRSRKVLASKRKELVSQGLGNKPNATRALTDSEEDKLWAEGEFGNSNPVSLQRTMWWFLSLHFGFRARDESRKLRWGDVILEKDVETGNNILVWRTERGTKTRTGEKENGHSRSFNPTIQATNSDRCPVKFYHIFKSHRPIEMNTIESPFYLAVKHNRELSDPVWYLKTPLGKNQIGKLMSSAAKAACISGGKKIANHSVRKTSIGRLLDADVAENYVAQLSGHKNLESLQSYKTPSLQHQRRMSETLSRAPQQSLLPQSSHSMSPHNVVPQSSSILSNCENSLPSSNPFLSSSSNSNLLGVVSGSSINSEGPTHLFAGAHIGHISNCTFQIMSGNAQDTAVTSPKKKRRRLIIESDDEAE